MAARIRPFGPAIRGFQRSLERIGQGSLILRLADRIGAARIAGFGEYRPVASDVIVCSYHKSGTNWALQLCQQIACRGRGEFGHIHDVVPWPDSVVPDYAVDLRDSTAREASPTGIRVIKTHLPMDALPYSPEARYLCVVRDPRDVAVSGFHFIRSVAMGPWMPSPPVFADAFIRGHTLNPCGTWAESTAAAWAVRDLPNVLFVTYEDMLAAREEVVDAVCGLLGVDCDAEERSLVIERTSFDYMRSIDEWFYPGVSSPFAEATGRMMRSGRSGVGQELFSGEQLQRIAAACREELLRLGSDFPFDRLYGPAAGDRH